MNDESGETNIFFNGSHEGVNADARITSFYINYYVCLFCIFFPENLKRNKCRASCDEMCL